MTDNEKLNKIIDTLFFGNKAEFARDVKVSPQTVTNWMKRGISKEGIALIQKSIQAINPEWLLTGNGEMLNTRSSNARLLGGVYASGPKDNEDVVMVDYVPGTATATFIEYNGGTNPQFEKIAVLKQYGEILDNSYKVFEVMGESMSPRIPNRAKILTKEIPASKWFMAEGVVVVVFGDEVVVKRIIDNDLATNNTIVLSSDNPMYGVRKVSLADIRYMYKAIRIISADIV